MVEPRAVLAERCPQLAVESVVPLGEGDFCTVHAVHTLDGEWVFRFELAEALDELASVRVSLDRRLDELLRTCLG